MTGNDGRFGRRAKRCMLIVLALLVIAAIAGRGLLKETVPRGFVQDDLLNTYDRAGGAYSNFRP